jgi:HEAT repeat protein
VLRAYAANALGEFFVTPGIAACAAAAVGDSDPGVRAAAATALGRLNDDGSGALGQAMGDSNPTVSLAALESSARINSYSAIASISALGANPNAFVRRRAMEVLDALDAVDTVLIVSLEALHDKDAGVRAAACHALGTFGNSAVVSVLQQLSQNDPDPFVRDEAQIALRRL